MHERAQLFTETQVVAKDGKSEGSFGADSSDYSQVGHVDLKVFNTNKTYTLNKRTKCHKLFVHEEMSYQEPDFLWRRRQSGGERLHHSSAETRFSPPATKKLYWVRQNPSLECIFFCRFSVRLSKYDRFQVISIGKFGPRTSKITMFFSCICV